MILDKMKTRSDLASFLLKCDTRAGDCFINEEQRIVFEEAAEMAGAILFEKGIPPADAYEVFSSNHDILLYWLHPRDAFMTRLLLLWQCYGDPDEARKILANALWGVFNTRTFFYLTLLSRNALWVLESRH